MHGIIWIHFQLTCTMPAALRSFCTREVIVRLLRVSYWITYPKGYRHTKKTLHRPEILNVNPVSSTRINKPACSEVWGKYMFRKYTVVFKKYSIWFWIGCRELNFFSTLGWWSKFERVSLGECESNWTGWIVGHTRSLHHEQETMETVVCFKQYVPHC